MAVTGDKLKVSYDDSTDVLYLSVGEPRPAITHEDTDDDTLLIRRDPVTDEVIGVTILNYYGRFRRLPDLSWLAKKDRPQEVIRYLRSRPQV